MRRASFREGAAFAGLSVVSLIALGLVSSIVIGRLYGARVLGQYALALAPATALGYLSTVREQAGMVRALQRLQPRDAVVTGIFGAVFAFSSALTIVVGFLVAAGAYFVLRGPVGQPEVVGPALVNLAGFVLITNTAWNIDMLLAAFRAGRELFWIRLDQAVGFLVLAIVGSLMWHSVWVLIWATIGSWSVALVHRAIVARRYLRYRVPRSVIAEGRRELPEILRFGIRIAPGGVATGLSDDSGTWSLGVLGTLGAVGAFNRAWLLARRFVDVTTRLMEMLFPTLVEHHQTGRRDEFERTLVESMRFATTALLLPAAAGGGAAAAVMSLFGGGFERASTALALLLLVPVANVLCAIQDHALYAVGHPTRATAIQIARFIVTIAACAVGTLLWGINGTAIGILLGYTLHFGLSTLSLRPHLQGAFRTWWSGRQLMGLGAGYAVAFLAAIAISHELSGALALAVTLPVASVVYVAVVAVVGGVNERDRAVVRAARARLPWRRPVAAT